MIWIKSARVLVDHTNCSGSLNSWPHSHTEWIPKWTTYSDFSQARSSRSQAAQRGSRCWNGFDSQNWEICFHRLAILLTFRETVDKVCVCGTNDTQTGDTKMTDFAKTTIWTGRTFDIRSQLKDLGAKWDDTKKAWTLDPVSRRDLVPVQRLSLRSGVDVVSVE